jgi:radical SAM superfamily enzyme YgiQ (UPF0313 family)
MNRKLIEKADALLEKERGTVFKDPGGRVSVCLVYPNTYHVGMSNLGFQGVYTLLNKYDGVVCERAFLPDPGDMEEYERTGSEVFSLESKRPLGRFDIAAFSVSFENDYPNVLKILQLSRIPLESAERGPTHPLLVMGGVCAFSNPEPLAGFFDVVFVGEAEEMLDEFMELYVEAGTREDLLNRAAGIGGIYVPRFYKVKYDEQGFVTGRKALGNAPERVKRRYVKDISKCPVMPSIITPETEFSEMSLVEAMRGCPWSCRFCLAGHVYKPSRHKGLEAIRKEIQGALERTKRVGLVGPSLSDYRHMEKVLHFEGVDFSIASLRASKSSAELVGLLKGQRSVSIAPEAGTQRLRDFIGKKITEEDILETSGLMLRHGIKRLRLYFMVGLPSETDEDIEGIVGLVRAVRERFRKGSITLTLSTFVPKPFTPFERRPMQDIKTVKERIRHVKKSLKPLRGVAVFHDVPKYAYMQGLFSMGDRRVGGVLRAMLWHEDWRQAARVAGVAPDFYIKRRKLDNEPLPWDFIDPGP